MRAKIIMLPNKIHGTRFEELVGPHLDHLYRIACRFTGNAADAEDVVQDLLIKLYPKPAQLEAVQQLRPWLTRALYYQYIDSVRRRASTPLGRRDELACDADEGDALDTLPGQGHDPEQDTEQVLTRERLHAAFVCLNEDQRAVIALHDVEGYSLDELTYLLDTPLGTLKSRLHRARQQLRALLQVEPDAGRVRVNERGA